MAASSITCCVSWPRKVLRSALFALSALATASCGAEEAVHEQVVEEVTESASREDVQGEVVDLTVEQLVERLEDRNVRLIDVRTAEEVAGGAIPGAEHVPLDSFDPAGLGLDDREVVLYCRSGRRSGLAAEKLAEFTGEPAQHLAGGILAWQEAGQPVE